MIFQTTARVLRNEQVGPDSYALEIRCPPIAETATAGQFVMVRVSPSDDPLLRRPFSIAGSYAFASSGAEKPQELLILYKRVGRGTGLMCRWKEGDEVDLIGPLGKGYTLPPFPSPEPIVLIGGGTGVASLYYLWNRLRGHEVSMLVGAKTRDDLLWPYRDPPTKDSLHVATEDGSLGFRGTVLDLFLALQEAGPREAPLRIYACGPTGMLRRLADLTRSERMIVEASFEARMACGLGACWGCVVKTTDSCMPYHRVCKEGPVFDLKTIAWEEG